MTTEPQRDRPNPNPAEEALHEQREWLRVTLSSIGDAVITTDTSGDPFPISVPERLRESVRVYSAC